MGEFLDQNFLIFPLYFSKDLRLFPINSLNLYNVEINRERENIFPLFYSNSFSNIVTQLSWDFRGSPKRIEVFRKVENLVRNGKVYHTGKNRKVDAPHNFQLHESSEILLSELCRVKFVSSYTKWFFEWFCNKDDKFVSKF